MKTTATWPAVFGLCGYCGCRQRKYDHCDPDQTKRILLYSSLSVERTAQMIGYPDPSNFYKAFREYYHMTPKQFVLDQRNRQQKKTGKIRF
ncbi:MAG TPA: hypothetical protein DCP49_10150 [Erysipelotrichaceae bacterium]|nr:hypothetical protein [Erysipelotrichaceae bacterium]